MKRDHHHTGPSRDTGRGALGDQRAHHHGTDPSRDTGRGGLGVRAALVTVLAAAGLALAGCGHPPPNAAAGVDQLGSLEASVDAVAGQVDSDTAG